MVDVLTLAFLDNSKSHQRYEKQTNIIVQYLMKAFFSARNMIIKEVRR